MCCVGCVCAVGTTTDWSPVSAQDAGVSLGPEHLFSEARFKANNSLDQLYSMRKYTHTHTHRCIFAKKKKVQTNE